MSLNAGGASFGNMSRISSNVTGGSTMLSDDVFEKDVTSAEDEPNWDKLLNEAQFVALKISDPAVPAKTPLSRSTTTGSNMFCFYSIFFRLRPLFTIAKLRNYSPGDMIDSPTSGMLMDSKDNPEAFLVHLTPESSPKKTCSGTRETNASPLLEKKTSKNIPVSGISLTTADPLKTDSDIQTNAEVTNSKTRPVKELGKSDAPARSLQAAEIRKNDSLAKKVTTPDRKSVKENIKPRVMDNADSKKVTGTLSNMKPLAKSRIGVKPPLSEVKRPATSSALKQSQSETKRIPLSRRPAAAVPVTPSRDPEDKSNGGPSVSQSAVKTLQFTPKNSVPRAPRRESISAVKAPLSKPAVTSHQFKLPSKTTDAHLKKTIVPPRTGRLQPTRLSLAPGGSSSSTGASSSMVQPRQAPLKPLGSGGLPKPTPSALPKSGLQRPGLYRQGADIILEYSFINSLTDSSCVFQAAPCVSP